MDTDIREQVREIMRGRRELRRARKEAIKNGNWEDIIPMLVVEEDSDVSSYREQTEDNKAGDEADARYNELLYCGLNPDE